MTDHRPLFDRLEALVDHNNRPDWEDVVRRAEAPGKAAPPARRSRRSYLVRRVVPVLVLVMVGLIVGLIPPWGGGSSFTARALAAIGDGSVIHVVLGGGVNPNVPVGAAYIDLASGQETPYVCQTEIWYDSPRDYLHTQRSCNGHIYDDELETPSGRISSLPSNSQVWPNHPMLDRALADFADGYRSALESGEAHVIGTGTFRGRDVTWIELATDKRGTKERVAVDAETSLPLRVEWHWPEQGSDASISFDVESIESLQEGNGDFTPPKEGPPVLYYGFRSYSQVSAPEAAASLPGSVSAGEKVSNLPLVGITRVRLLTGFTKESGLQELSTTGLALVYGGGRPFAGANGGRPGNEDFVWIEEAARPLMHIGWWRVGYYAPPPGTILTLCGEEIAGTGGPKGTRGRSGCEGFLAVDGVFVHIDSTSRDLLLTAARSLTPIQPSVSEPGATTEAGTTTG